MIAAPDLVARDFTPETDRASVGVRVRPVGERADPVVLGQRLLAVGERTGVLAPR